MLVSDWMEDLLSVIDRVVVGDVIIVASSMGGWLSLHAATIRPDRIKGLVLIGKGFVLRCSEIIIV